MADADREAGNRPNSSAVMSIATIRQGLKIRRPLCPVSCRIACYVERAGSMPPAVFTICG